MNNTVNKGVILSISGNTAKVAPVDNMENVSQYIKIASHVTVATLSKGSLVAYTCFDDETGIILAKLE